jgi:alpha-methylacyl-CoA racemase
MALQVDEYLATGAEPEPRHGLLTGRYACYDTYPTRDGKWVTVAAIEPRFWANLCAALALDHWAEHQHDDAVPAEIRADVRAAFLTRDRDEWTAMLAPADTCVAPVLTIPELVDDEQYIARGAFVEATHPEHGSFCQVGPMFAGMLHPEEPYVARDATVTHTEVLLQAAGLSADECAKLREGGVIA